MARGLFTVAFFLIVASLFTSIMGFSPRPTMRAHQILRPVSMVQFDVIGKNLEVTSAIRAHLDKKLGPVLSKLGRNVNSAHVSLHCEKCNGEQAQIVETTLNMKGGAVIRSVVDDDNDMYAAIDRVSHIISNNLKKHSETHRSLKSKRIHQKVLVMNEYNEEENIIFDGESMPELSELALGANTLKRLDMFSTTPTTIEDATRCLEVERHEFYAFRNKETKEINIVYRMKNGKVGLIQPADNTLLKFAKSQEECEGEAFSFEDETFPKIAHHDSY